MSIVPCIIITVAKRGFQSMVVPLEMIDRINDYREVDEISKAKQLVESLGHLLPAGSVAPGGSVPPSTPRPRIRSDTVTATTMSRATSNASATSGRGSSKRGPPSSPSTPGKGDDSDVDEPIRKTVGQGRRKTMNVVLDLPGPTTRKSTRRTTVGSGDAMVVDKDSPPAKKPLRKRAKTGAESEDTQDEAAEVEEPMVGSSSRPDKGKGRALPPTSPKASKKKTVSARDRARKAKLDKIADPVDPVGTAPPRSQSPEPFPESGTVEGELVDLHEWIGKSSLAVGVVTELVEQRVPRVLYKRQLYLPVEGPLACATCDDLCYAPVDGKGATCLLCQASKRGCNRAVQSGEF